MNNQLRILALEVTSTCPLQCRHCRGSCTQQGITNELNIHEIENLFANISSFAAPLVIITGGEPLARKDIFDIIEIGNKYKLPMALATCGWYMDRQKALAFKQLGIKRISLSMDAFDQEGHDAFRGIIGSYAKVREAAGILNEIGLDFQINTTISNLNWQTIPQIVDTVTELKACAWHPFILVPTGRGKTINNLCLEKDQYRQALLSIKELQHHSQLQIKPTCAPYYARLNSNNYNNSVKTNTLHSFTRGCLGGINFAFISSRGKVQICGFLDIEAGDLRNTGFKLDTIWNHSQLFTQLRNRDNYKGKCGKCGSHNICGGCRSRAYYETNDFLESDSSCFFLEG
ncbi:MAG: hypothetical protein A2X42_03670 [Candidatus Margulisbacteria bacterium GWF2_38_17]|nr:MAG: hypothetical protein A2X43_06815 [Candidatus Margulisbacteria bacterium GWD2_39_127]OGI05270.1 MAG: hypothetical protein A2X42_03670 [Candidatus Margulisbacteria bacterium GWF2_38_17]OGI10871.1 MAG: hypothetical protein A2X41_05805 [Candidatus Margulisbacteria bacterium GWE2_39_32]